MVTQRELSNRIVKKIYESKENLSPCPECQCMTKSIRLGRAKYQCGKCKADKSLSDVYYYEATNKLNLKEKE